MRKFKNTVFVIIISIAVLFTCCDPNTDGTEDLSTETEPGIDSSADSDAVSADLDALSTDDIIFKSGDGFESVTGDFSLPKNGANGTAIVWSEKEDTADNIQLNGYYIIVTRPSAGTGNASVVLTAEVTRNSISDSKDFTFTILEISDEEAVAEAKNDLSVEDLLFSGSDNTDAVTGNFTVPLSGSHGTAIAWEDTYDPDGCFSVSGDSVSVTRPLLGAENTTATLTATISFDSSSETKDFVFTILADFMSGVTFSSVPSWDYTIPAENPNARIFELPGDTDAYAVAVAGNYAYVSFESFADNNPVYIFNISNPSAPAAKYSMAFGVILDYMEVVGDFIYATGASRLYPIDISDPENPEIFNPLITSTFMFIDSIQEDNGILFYGGDNTVGTIDISNPYIPSEMDSCTLSAGNHYFSVYHQGYIYVANGIDADSKFAVIDASDPADLDEIYMGDLDENTTFINGIAAGDGYAYLTDTNGFDQVNITTPAAPVYQTTILPAGYYSVGRAEIYNDVLYGIDMANCNVFRIDISNPLNPVALTEVIYGNTGTGYNPAAGNDIVIDSGYLYISCFDIGTSGCHGFVIVPDI